MFTPKEGAGVKSFVALWFDRSDLVSFLTSHLTVLQASWNPEMFSLWSMLGLGQGGLIRFLGISSFNPAEHDDFVTSQQDVLLFAGVQLDPRHTPVACDFWLGVSWLRPDLDKPTKSPPAECFLRR